MPVTVRGAPVEVKSLEHDLKLHTPAELLQETCKVSKKDEEILESSFLAHEEIQPSRNGFVRTALDAYLQHNHLVLRPEDVWFGILTQFSFYVNKHAEELRSYFVSHEGKKPLEIVLDYFAAGVFAVAMTDLIAQNIKDPYMREWIMPSFTTTTETDLIVASILMMGTMQKYFVYFMGITCGIPSVTLLGEKSDWEDILERVEYLETFDDHQELQLWYQALNPVLKNFVRTFDEPDSAHISRFWQQTVHEHDDHYFGQKHLTGWILAFCFWDTEGNPLVAETANRTGMAGYWEKTLGNKNLDFVHRDHQWDHPRLEWNDVPSGYADVPVHVWFEGGPRFQTKMLAGSVGWKVLNSSSVLPTDWQKKNSVSSTSGLNDTIQPVSGWWMFKTDAPFGRDADCPDIQFDSDADDYDEALLEKCRPGQDEGHEHLEL